MGALVRRMAMAAAVALGAAAVPAIGAQEILLTPRQALREIFPTGARTVEEERTLTPAMRTALVEELGRQVFASRIPVTKVYDGGGRFLGYAVITEETGKYRPITFMVGVTPEFTVRDVAVLVYRESRGGDVKRKRFLAQYRGKGTGDPIDSNRDIINISGATISVRSMNAGVKRVLAELTLLYSESERLAGHP